MEGLFLHAGPLFPQLYLNLLPEIGIFVKTKNVPVCSKRTPIFFTINTGCLKIGISFYLSTLLSTDTLQKTLLKVSQIKQIIECESQFILQACNPADKKFTSWQNFLISKMRAVRFHKKQYFYSCDSSHLQFYG